MNNISLTGIILILIWRIVLMNKCMPINCDIKSIYDAEEKGIWIG